MKTTDKTGLLASIDRFVGQVGKVSASRAADPGSNPAFAMGILPGRVLPVTFKKMALQWLPCQTPGFIGSALGLVDPVSVYCDWERVYKAFHPMHSHGR